MRRALLVPFVAAAALALAAPAAFADGAVVVRDIERNVTQVIAFTNPCTGAEGTVTITFNGVFRLTQRPNDTVSLTSNATGSYLLVPNDPSTPVSSGRFASTDVIGGGANDVETSVLTAHGTSADGTRFSLVFVTHLTETGTGITLSFDRCN
jgi:hypothetical protein